MTANTADSDYVWCLCESLRQHVGDILGGDGGNPFGVSYVSMNAPAWDLGDDENCSDIMTVHWVSTLRAAPGRQEDRNRRNALPHARLAVQMEIQMIWCATGVVDDGPPPPELLAAESRRFYSLAWTAYVRLVRESVKTPAELFPLTTDCVGWEPPDCSRVDVDPIVPMGPQGSGAGFRIPILVELG